MGREGPVVMKEGSNARRTVAFTTFEFLPPRMITSFNRTVYTLSIDTNANDLH